MNAFSSVMGHDRAITLLSKMLEHGTIPHAFLFVGARGLGRTTVAKALIGELLGQQVSMDLHPDVHTLQVLSDEKTGKLKKNISVEQVRELNGRIAMTSLSGSWKIVWIEEAEKLSMGAANALLKTLEEPKGQTLFILRAPEVDQLPATVVSRCQTVRFSTVARQDIVDGLVRLGFAPSDASRAAARSMGRPGLALRYLKDTAYRSLNETGVAQAQAFLSAGLPERLAQVLEMIPKAEVNKMGRLSEVVDQLQLVCRDRLLDSVGCSSLCVTEETSGLKGLTQADVIVVLDRLAQVRSAISQNINPHLALEHVALSA